MNNTSDVLKAVTETITNGIATGASAKAAALLTDGVKKLAGSNYPAVFDTDLGKRLEPMIIPLLVQVASQFYQLDNKDSMLVPVTKVREYAKMALTHEVAVASKDGLSDLQSLILGLANTLPDLPGTTTP
jgi:hypothetical protein